MRINTFLACLIFSTFLTTPAYGYVFKDKVQCSYQKPSKTPVIDQCILEGASTRGNIMGIISWSDGVQTKYKGAWGSVSNWTIDGHQAKLIEASQSANSTRKACLQSQVSGIIICWWRQKSVENSMISETVQPNKQNVCTLDKNFAPASNKYRTLKLEHYGIEVDIPINYRSIKERDGTVKIIHPNYFALFQCIKNGGRGEIGYESLDISLIDRNSSISLKEQAIFAVGYKINDRGEKEPTEVEIFNYQAGEIAGYIVISKRGQSSVFTGLIRGSDKILQVSSNASYKDISNLLFRLRLIK